MDAIVAREFGSRGATQYARGRARSPFLMHGFGLNPGLCQFSRVPGVLDGFLSQITRLPGRGSSFPMKLQAFPPGGRLSRIVGRLFSPDLSPVPGGI